MSFIDVINGQLICEMPIAELIVGTLAEMLAEIIAEGHNILLDGTITLCSKKWLGLQNFDSSRIIFIFLRYIIHYSYC